MPTERRLRAVEFVVWVVAVSAAVVAATTVVGVAAGGLLVAKFLLFFVGVMLFGVGSLAIQPDKPTGESRWFSFDEAAETRIDEAVQRLPPLSGNHLPAEDRIGHGFKLLAVGVVVAGTSVWLEFGLGVAV